MDYNLLVLIKEQLLQVLELVLGLLSLAGLYMLVRVRKDLKKLKDHLTEKLGVTNKENLILQEKEKTQAIEELDTLRTTNPTLYLQAAKHALYLKNQSGIAGSVEEGATKL
jgi:hypothetical protein